METTGLNEAKFKNKLLLSYLSSPMVLLPVLGGVTDLLTLWTFSIDSGIGIFAGLAGILGGLGIFLTKLLTGDDRINRRLLNQMEQDTQKERSRSLDQLDQKLSEDGDPRTEGCLRDLRTLADAFREKRSWTESLNSSSTFDILSGVEQLFSQCVRYLEKSLNLWYTAQNMTTLNAQEPLLAQREQLIEDVGLSIKQLGGILAGIQGLESGSASTESDLARIRNELDQSLAVAKSVRERMSSLDDELNLRI